MKPERVRRVVDALLDGKTVARISGEPKRGHVSEQICCRMQLHGFVKKHPVLGRRIMLLAQRNEQEAKAQYFQSRHTRIPAELAKNNGIDAFAAIVSATEELPAHLKDEVRSAMFLAVAEGRLNLRDATARVREFVTLQYRMFTKFVPGGGGIMRSLDEQVYDDGPTTLGDSVTHGLWG